MSLRASRGREEAQRLPVLQVVRYVNVQLTLNEPVRPRDDGGFRECGRARQRGAGKDVKILTERMSECFNKLSEVMLTLTSGWAVRVLPGDYEREGGTLGSLQNKTSLLSEGKSCGGERTLAASFVPGQTARRIVFPVMSVRWSSE